MFSEKPLLKSEKVLFIVTGPMAVVLTITTSAIPIV